MLLKKDHQNSRYDEQSIVQPYGRSHCRTGYSPITCLPATCRIYNQGAISTTTGGSIMNKITEDFLFRVLPAADNRAQVDRAELTREWP